MGPVKYDDISKVATEVLNDDFQVAGYTFKAKQKTNWQGAMLSSQVDLFDTGCATPAKLTWKFPKPFGCPSFCVDKLEMDKGGKFKFEVSAFPKNVKGVRLDCKSDLVDKKKILAGITYTGIKDAQLKLECKPSNPQDFVAEATYNHGIVTCGAKMSPAILKARVPEFGLRFHSGPLFGAVFARDSCQSFNAAAMYKVNDDVKCAVACQFAMKTGLTNAIFGLSYRNLYKVKVAQDQTVSVAAKHHVSKGFTVLTGTRYNLQKGDYSYGLQLSIE